MTLNMTNRAEAWLPKLVLAPAVVLGFSFIYGFMIWNGVLSVSASRMLPNYEFVGLAQYARLWEMDRWWVALRNLLIQAEKDNEPMIEQGMHGERNIQ